MNETVISLLRRVRTALQVLAEPVDWAARMLNNKHGYPPLHLRQKVGDLSDFEGSGGEYLAYLKLLCGLKPGHRLVDIGCGCGLMCLDVTGNSLIEYLGPYGQYLGVDIDRGLVKWCSKRVSKKHPICWFIATKSLPLRGQFDVVLCKSLFTHLLPDETIKYLKMIRDMLVPGGSCLSTWFLLSAGARWTDRSKYKFKYADTGSRCAYARETNKRLAVAYDEGWILTELGELNFSAEVWYGSWRGNGGGLSFQDIIVMRS